MKIHRLDFANMKLKYLGDTDGNLPDLYQNIINDMKYGSDMTLIANISCDNRLEIEKLLKEINDNEPEDINFVPIVERLATVVAAAGNLGDDFCRNNLRGLCRAWYQIALQQQKENKERQRKIAQLNLEIIDLKRKLEQGS